MMSWVHAGQVLSLHKILYNSTSCKTLSISQDTQWYQWCFVWWFRLGSIHAHDVWRCLHIAFACILQTADPWKHVHHWCGIHLHQAVVPWWSLQTAFSSSNSGTALLTATLTTGIRCAVFSVFGNPKFEENGICPQDIHLSNLQGTILQRTTCLPATTEIPEKTVP